ncbi:putative mosc domain-containing protein [Zalerion maritima]|uniref:Mosc domain-containing protein n=1 Tax=Zalerion maritima TaxID=339359 RepID=A0AAD5RIZ5_9PEZI|nr:putative mosc domain-containing protein [Zalerion maritima]
MANAVGDIPPELLTPFTTDTILEVRTGKIQNMPGLSIPTGIFKSTHSERLGLTDMGFNGDEHDYTFHGGKDKAVHGYCKRHYEHWRARHPEKADKFVPGGFGENLVLEKMNERNICIGDVLAISTPEGEEVARLQVSLPRQPCFKLNHRFGIKDFAPTTYETSRTGYYFRVLREGSVGIGDTITLVERTYPQWNIERVQEYLHRDTDNEAMNVELSQLGVLGAESKERFKKRAAKAERARRRKELGEDEKAEKWRPFKVVEKKEQTPRIVSYVLETSVPDPDADERLRPGAHARLKLGNGLLRSYSIVGGSANRFEIGVALADDSRGGSKFLHEQVDVGHVLEVVSITESVRASKAASKHIFIAGGVGITAFLHLLELMKTVNWEAECHYGIRSMNDIPFRERLDALGNTVKFHAKDEGQRMDVKGIIDNIGWNHHLYVCGPPRLMDTVVAEVARKGISQDDVHYEAFQADTSGDPFEVVVENRGSRQLKVGKNETLLEILRRDIESVPSSCEAGNCGTCKIAVKSGRVEHRGTGLLEGMKNEYMLSCVSRGIGKIAIEI